MCDFDDCDWQDMAMAGTLSEEMADEEKKQGQEEDVFDLDKENLEFGND
ncbi:MAG: hypothetical protein JW927_01215 [Deltaproteobacteria bacterium]|nr:hypothetical protein [Deltaproteobacteria bacterium]